eukprot:4273416-Prymnesium_polylepis.2
MRVVVACAGRVEDFGLPIIGSPVASTVCRVLPPHPFFAGACGGPGDPNATINCGAYASLAGYTDNVLDLWPDS